MRLNNLGDAFSEDEIKTLREKFEERSLVHNYNWQIDMPSNRINLDLSNQILIDDIIQLGMTYDEASSFLHFYEWRTEPDKMIYSKLFDCYIRKFPSDEEMEVFNKAIIAGQL